MSRVLNNFSKFNSSFEVLEELDLNYQTPTSSTRVQKKLFNTASSERRDTKVTAWHERHVMNKHPLQITTLSIKTPPMNKSPLIQPLAPIKSRKAIDKTDLKPKKLVFKDIEEPEMEIIKYPSNFSVKHDDNNFINDGQYKSKICRKKHTDTDEKENNLGLSRHVKNKKSTNNKENVFKSRGNNTSRCSNNSNSSNALSVIQSNNSQVKSGYKHLRI